MKSACICIASAFLLFVFSCKKQGSPANNNTVSTTDSIEYNLNKITLLQLLNKARQTGCTCGTTVMPPVPALAWNDLLAKAAYNHSHDMDQNNYFSHTGLDGSSPGDRITAVGYNWTTWGENIAMGYPDEQSVMNAWLNSPPHCMNIMNGNFKEIGAGKSGTYWTEDFGSK